MPDWVSWVGHAGHKMAWRRCPNRRKIRQLCIYYLKKTHDLHIVDAYFGYTNIVSSFFHDTYIVEKLCQRLSNRWQIFHDLYKKNKKPTICIWWVVFLAIRLKVKKKTHHCWVLVVTGRHRAIFFFSFLGIKYSPILNTSFSRPPTIPKTTISRRPLWSIFVFFLISSSLLLYLES